jgi:hypothetical protein
VSVGLTVPTFTAGRAHIGQTGVRQSVSRSGKLQLQETGALIPDTQEAKCARHGSAQASIHESFQDDLKQRHSPGRVTKMAASNGNFAV